MHERLYELVLEACEPDYLTPMDGITTEIIGISPSSSRCPLVAITGTSPQLIFDYVVENWGEAEVWGMEADEFAAEIESQTKELA